MSQPLTPRRAQRKAILLAATCRTGSGLRDNCHISDISPQGCRLTTSTLMVNVGSRVIIRPQGLDSVSGVIRWIEGQHAGVEFDSPLYEPVVDHLSVMHAAGRSVGVSSYPGRH